MYTVSGDFSVELVKLLPKNFTIKSNRKEFKINKQWLTVISQYFADLFSDFDLIEIDLPIDKHLGQLIDFLNMGEYKSADLTDVLELLLLVKKYLIKDIDLIKNLNNLTIPDHLFSLYIDYLKRLFDNNLVHAVDLIAKEIKPDTDLSLFEPSILKLINQKKRHYGTGKMTALIKELEKNANEEKKKHVKKYIFEAYDLRENRLPDYRYINLNLIYETHSVAEAVLKFRDNVIYSTVNLIEIKKHIDYIDPDDNQRLCTPFLLQKELKENDIFRPYVLRYLDLMHTEINYFSQGSIKEIEQKINGMIMLGGFRIIELI